MNGHQQAKLHKQAKARYSLTDTRRGLSIALLAAFIVSVMAAWFGFLGWGLIELLLSLVGFVRHLWSII
jgi:hypothetical protein